MIADVWNALRDYLKRTPLWPYIEPVFLVGFLYVGVVVSAFQYIQWRYGAALSLPLFLRSYVFREVSVAFAAVLISYLILVAPLRTAQAFGKHTTLLARLAMIVLVGAGATLLWRALSPHREVGSIRVMVAPPGEFRVAGENATPDSGDTGEDMVKHRDLLVYLLFEMNRLQRNWHFEMDFSLMRKSLAPENSYCDRETSPAFCYAQQQYDRNAAATRSPTPLLLIISEPLTHEADEALFWRHGGAVSVITTYDWRGKRVPSVLDYLVYTITLQAIITHLDTHCPQHALTTYVAGTDQVHAVNTGDASHLAAERSMQESSRVVNGNVFEYAPRSEALKAAILAGRLGPEDEVRLLNCFGPEYLQTASELLRMDWLHSDHVRANLGSAYGVESSWLQGPK